MPRRGDWVYEPYTNGYDIWDGARWCFVPSRDLLSKGVNTNIDLRTAVARSELTIKLVTYNDSKESLDAITDAAREAARTLVTVAMMLQEKRSPEIALFTEDFFEGTKELVVDTDGETTND